jgi:hypothetical protein
MDFNDRIDALLSAIKKHNGKLTGSYVTKYILGSTLSLDPSSVDVVVTDSVAAVHLTNNLTQKQGCYLTKSHDDVVTMQCPTYCGGYANWNNLTSFNWWRRGCPKVTVTVQDVLTYHNKLKDSDIEDNSGQQLLYDPKADNLQAMGTRNLKSILKVS